MKRTKRRSVTALKGPRLRYLYDLTTSAHWGGADVGILRVERQLARRARQYLGSALEFCLYDRFRNLVLTIDDDLAAALIEGRTQIDFTPPPALSRARTGFNQARCSVRRAVLANATLYHALQRLRGRSFSHEDILRIQTEELAGSAATTPRSGPLPLADVPLRIARLDADTLLISGGLDWDYKDPRALAALKREYRFRYCAIVYDLIAVLLPHLVVPDLSSVLANYFKELVWLADDAMCISETTRRDWVRYRREQRADDSGQAFVFPLGSDLPAMDSTVQADFPEALRDKQFALFVSTIEARKNHRMLYEAWDRCIRSKMVDPDRDRLVFVGRRGWAVNDLMRELSANPATRETLIVLNHVPDALLRRLYQRCAFAVFPSLYEGYGLPLAEALAYGKPCISSDAGSLPEIGDDLVLRIDPKDTIRWADALAHYLGAPRELDQMAARVKAEFKPVTWDQAAARFFGTVKTMTR
jgi:glycosyltransferase involved in cell wall biosynthesis